MRMDRFTTAAQQVLADAQSDALGRSNPEVTGLHLLSALLADAQGTARGLVARAGGNAERAASIAASRDSSGVSRLRTIDTSVSNS